MRLILVLAALAPLAPTGVSAQPAADKKPIVPAIQRFSLANGLEVAVLPVESPAATVQIWYRAGSKDEPRDHRGTAHMFEHMMQKGSAHVRPDAHAQMLASVGGNTQAATDEDATHFSDSLPPEHVDFAIRLEAERMRNLLFRPEMIAVEKEFVKEEVRVQESQPVPRGFLRLLDIAYSKHPYAWTAAGNVKELDATTPEDLKKFYDAYYQPNNALLVVTGKVTVEQVKASAEKWFGPIAKAAAPPRPSQAAAEPNQTTRRREMVEAAPRGAELIGFHIPAAKDKDIYALQLASIILGGGETSRLKTRLTAEDPKLKRPLALDAGVEAVVREEPGMMIAVARYRDPEAAEPIEAAVFDEIGKIVAKGPTADELRRAKNHVQSGFTFSLETTTGLATAIGRSWTLVGDPTAFVRDLDEIEKVSAADVSRVVKKYMTAENATVVIVPPRVK